MAISSGDVRLRDFFGWAGPILGPDSAFFRLMVVYGIGIGLLSLATPISVQMLINSVANTALPAPLFTLAAVLLVLLLISALLGAFRTHLMEMFRRRFFARLVAETTLRAVHAQNPFFHDERRGDLFNRYFDVMTVQKAIPSLLIGGFTIILQATVGFIVTAFYHPFFLAFNLGFIFAVWLIWRLWSRGAMRTAVALSQRKYEAAHWLESVGGSNGFYKSSRHLDFAMDRSEDVTAAYVKGHAAHFRCTFPQSVALLMLYAFASAGLLALGGWLVIQGQLSIGQLVAAELILSSIFYGAAQLGPYLDSFYDLVAGVEELSQILAIPQEQIPEPKAQPPRPVHGALALSSVRVRLGNEQAQLAFGIPAGSRLVACAAPGMDRLLSGLLKRHIKPDSGIITLGGADITALDTYQLRSDVIVLDRPTIVESSIRDYLALACAGQEPTQTMDALRLVGLDQRIAMLADGMDTRLSSTGWPLTLVEMMQLKLASAVLAEPRILVLSALYDMVPADRMQAVFAALAGKPITILYFSGRPHDISLDGWFWLGRDSQRIMTDRAQFDRVRLGGDRPADDQEASDALPL
ncbi:ABC transporter ATP-binding protein [Sphingobium algorifonticola]|uniref:ABC transporter ATP-binding protein n=1 Tax=Sphingobium algorifonticola TaxID=2008318 RepID=A0A437J619_9SPHN|nr:ABC transporter ATP-binding protein [Sphingobium algorifonticola]RVT40291.1 ABC transporter ATP-binding protein [Sphingobium algorifonticola]